jgi:hypothetical protein
MKPNKEVKLEKEASAVVTGHGTHVTVKELAKIKTPQATDSWKPIPHVEVPQIITQMVKQNGWSFIGKDDPFQLTLSKDNAKLFGVCKVEIPGLEKDNDFQLAIGFRNSHDKTLALRIAVGSHVMVCSNLMLTGDIQVRRIHTLHIDVEEAVTTAFQAIPDAAKKLFAWMDHMRTVKISEESGVAFLADAVEVKALAVPDFMPARESYLKAYRDENPAIAYGNTIWAAYQAVTEQYKDRSLRWNQCLSTNLNRLVEKKTGMLMDLKNIERPIEDGAIIVTQ